MMSTLITSRVFWGEITGVFVDGAGATSQVRASAETVTYDAVGQDGLSSVNVTNATPYNRAFRKASIITARVGDAVMFQVPHADGVEPRLYVWTEREDHRNCDLEPIEDLDP